MARYKLGPQGAYYDAEDSGPDQASPEQIAALQGGSSQPAGPAAPGEGPNADVYTGPMGADGPIVDKSQGEQAPYTPPDLMRQMHQMSDEDVYNSQGGYSGGGVTGNGSVSASQLSPDGAAPSPYIPTSNPQPASDPMADKYAQPGQIDETTGQPTTPASAPGPESTATPVAPAAPAAPTAAAAGPVGAMPIGFDANKWNDPNKHDPKYDVGHLLSDPSKTNADAFALLDAKYPGRFRQQGSDSVVEISTGEIYDFRNGTTNQAQWTGVGNINDSGGSGGGGGQAGAGGGGSMGNPFGGGPMGEAIARLLSRGESGVDPNNPNIAGPTAAFRADLERNGRRTRNAMAERAGAEGLNPGGEGSGAFDSAVQSQLEGEGIATANFRGKLTTDEIASQRQDVINALQLAQGEERIYLQQYLAQLNDQLQRAQLSQQNNQWYDDFTYRQGRDAYDRSADYYGNL